MDEQEYRKVFDKALNILTRRQHCREELRRKLFQKKFSSSLISSVLAELERLNLVNDETFALDYMNELKTKGYGPYKIKKSLSNKGLSQELIKNVIGDANNPEEELEFAREAMNKKLRSLKNEKDPLKKRGKLFRFLAARGFSGQIISILLKTSEFY